MEYNVSVLKQKFMNAHAAGDTRAAQLFANKIKEMEQVAPVKDDRDEYVQSILDRNDADYNMAEKGVMAFTKGVNNLGDSIKEGFYRATDNDDALSSLNKRLALEDKAWDNFESRNPNTAFIGETAGEIVATLPVGGVAGKVVGSGLTALTKSGTLLNKAAPIAAAVADGAVSAGVMQRGDLDTRMDTATDAGLVSGAVASGFGIAGKIGNKVLNRGKHFTTDLAKRGDDIAESTGLPVHLTDVMPDGGALAKAEGLVNDVPIVGTGAGKRAQNAAAKGYVQDKINGLGYENVVDAQEGLAKSINDIYAGNQETKRSLYNKFWDSLDTFGDVPRDRTNAVIESMLEADAKAGGVGGKFTKLLKELKATPDGGASTLHHQFQVVRSKAKQGRLGGPDEFYAGKMNELADAMKADAVAFAKKMEDDIGEEVAGLSTKLAEADDYFIKNIKPFKENRVLKSAINGNDPEKIYKELLAGGGSRKRIKEVYHALNDEGKKRLQSAFLLDAYNKSMHEGVLSAKTFRTHIDKFSETTGILFKGEDKKLFNKIADVMEFSKNSAQAASNPMNGSRMVMASFLGGAMAGSVVLAGKVGAAAGFFKIATQTKGARRFFTASTGRTASTKGMDATVDYVGGALQKYLALQEVDNEDN